MTIEEDMEVLSASFKLELDDICDIEMAGSSTSEVEQDYEKSGLHNETVSDSKYDNTLHVQLPHLQISLHPTPHKSCSKVDANLQVSDLTSEMIRLLELRLNPSVVGAEKNWEFLYVKLGASMDEVTNIRYNFF